MTRATRPRGSVPWTWLWLLPGLAFMGALFVLPICRMAWDSVSDPVPGLGNYAAILSERLYLRVFWNSIWSATGATLASVLIGYALAYAICRASGRRRRLILGLVMFSYVVGTVPRAFSWLVVLGDRGLANLLLLRLGITRSRVPLIYNEFGVLVGMIHVMLPFVTLILLGSMLRVGAHLVPAARTLGATSRRAFWEVFVPLTRPGVLAAMMIVFVYSLGFYIVPAVLGGAGQTTIVMEIQELALNLGDWGLAAALSTAVVLVSILGAAMYVRTTGLADVHGHE